MALEHFLEEEDEGNSLLGGRPSRGGGASGYWPRDLASKAEALQWTLSELSWQAKVALAVVAVTLFGFVNSSRGSAHGGPPQLGLKLRGLANGDELQWAEDTFGLFLQKAVPGLEKANFDCKNFLNMLPQGQCEEWTKVFAETGVFSFSIPLVKGEFSTRQQLRDAMCRDTVSHIRAIRLIWNFPDAERLSGLSLFEVFTQDPGGGVVEKARWAQFAHLAPGREGMKIQEFRLYVESTDEGQMKDSVDGVVQANLRRLNGHDCSGFEAALPSTGTETWMMQSMPIGTGKKDELDDKPRDQILAKCKRDTEGDWKSIDLQHASIEGIFPSASDREVFVFFHKEKRWKRTIDVTDDPEALLVKLDATQAPKVNYLHFFTLEGIHIAEEWSWKYGWASHHPR